MDAIIIFTMPSIKRNIRNPKSSIKYTTHRVGIDENISSLIISLMDYDIKISYAALGAQLAQIDRPFHALQIVKMAGFATGFDVPRISIDYVLEGYEFVRVFWSKMIIPICKWWQRNKGKEGKQLMKEICAIVTYILPQPYNLIQGVISILAVIIMKNGLEKLCLNKIIQQPPEP